MPATMDFVLGKGGVGKTTLAAALALSRAARGERVALASLLDPGEFGPLLDRGWGPGDRPRIELLEIDPRAILEGVVRRIVPLPALSMLLTAHPAFEAVYGIAPGVKEVAVLHRLLELADAGGLDRIVVDGLATGHGTHFLEAPRKASRILVGNLAQRARLVDAALVDPARTGVLLASTLEEAPVRETVELAARLRGDGFPLRAVVVNRWLEPLVPEASRGALARLAARGPAGEVGSELGLSWRSVQDHARAALHLDTQAREMHARLPELEALGLPLVRAPLVPRDEGRLRALAAALEGAGL